jgi:hypothetical protein
VVKADNTEKLPKETVLVIELDVGNAVKEVLDKETGREITGIVDSSFPVTIMVEHANANKIPSENTRVR